MVDYSYGMLIKNMNRKKVESQRKLAGIRLVLAAICGVLMGYLTGSSFPRISTKKVDMPRLNLNREDDGHTHIYLTSQRKSVFKSEFANSSLNSSSRDNIKIYVATNPRGAKSLPPGIVEPYSDLYIRGMIGEPGKDLAVKPKYLLALTVGYLQKDIINTIVSKFTENFSFVLFHYDGKASEWEEFEWSRQAIHISARKQAKWWYVKRFLHPDIVAPYEYIFIWDEDLGVEHFNAEEYMKLIRKHGLEISQPGVESKQYIPWMMTKRRDDVEIHKETEERPGWCHDPHLPPCAGFVEIMAPVFSRESWRCVWHMIQNDLVHGWGLDLALQRCVEPPYEKIGIVDAQWIEHKVLPSLGNQGESKDGKAPWEGVRARCNAEWKEFRSRMDKAVQKYLHHPILH